MAVDMIMDVMRAAQPAPATLKKLGKAGEPAASAAKSLFATIFSRTRPETAAKATASPAGDLVADVMAAADAKKLAAAKVELQGGEEPTMVATVDDKTRKAYQALESNLMANALQSMMPEGEGSLYGEGTAGDVWRGMMVDQMALAASQDNLFGLLPQTFRVTPTGAAEGETSSAVFNLLPGRRKITPFAG
jgi:hypothetical protein